jgi:diguanylate cyclase (GGDEF)-like protein
VLSEDVGVTTAFEACGSDHPANVNTRQVIHETDRSVVYRVYLPELERMVVCKRPQGLGAAARLLHERRILERLTGIEGVPVLVAGVATDGTLTFEDDAGIPLQRVAQQYAPVEVAAIGQALARILAAIHRLGVLHKDINPSNIVMRGAARRPMLIDFDLATTFAEERPGFIHHREIMGTLRYLAPEQTGRMARAIDQRTDLYALGITLYELILGDPPFRGTDPLELIRDHLATVPTAPASIDATIPAGLSDIIMRLLEKEPDRRYQSAEGLAHDLTRLGAALARGEGGSFRLCERDFPRQLATPRLIGRDQETAMIRRAFEAAVQGSGVSILVSGAPGVGKTALIEELRPIVTARRGWFVSGKVDQFRHDTAAGPFTQAFRGLGRMLLAEPPAEIALHRTRILAALGDNAGMAAAFAPEFPALLGPQPAMPPADLGRARARGVAFGLSLLRAIASPARPVALVLDDLQWADPITIELFEAFLVNRIPGLFLVGAYRAAELGAEHPLAQLIARQALTQFAPGMVHLANLPSAHVTALLGEMLRLTPIEAARLTSALGGQTGGNPFDTMELVNALRRDGLLTQGEPGWEWDDAAIRWRADRTDVVQLLTSRIASLPEPAPSVIALMACLGGEVELGVLDAASGLDSVAVREALLAPLEEGLLVWSSNGTVQAAGAGEIIRFRHDRVHQAAYDGIGPERRATLHLAIARRLAVWPEHAGKAAEQYLPVVECVQEEDERRRVVELFRRAAAAASFSSIYSAAEHLLAAALNVLQPVATAGDAALLIALRTGLHRALSSLGRQQEADGVYAALEPVCTDPLLLVAPARLQISGLANRDRHAEALALGFGLLARLGVTPPDISMQSESNRPVDAMRSWIEGDLEADARRADVEDPRIRAAAHLISVMVASAYYSNFAIHTQLILLGQRLWVEHGPCGALAGVLSCAGIVTVNSRQDYDTGYRVIRHVLAVGEARHYEPATSQVRHMLSRTALHWFVDLEPVAELARRARLGLLQGGELQIASFTYYTTLTTLLEYAPVLDHCEAEADLAVSFALRTGNYHAAATFTVFRQVARALRGLTASRGSFSDADFDEAGHLAGLSVNRMAETYHHVYRALTAALFDDGAALIHHAAVATVLRHQLDSLYPISLAYLLQGLALARRLRSADKSERSALFAEFADCRTWLAQRAASAPGNYLHLVHLLDAELAWANGDYWAAQCAFDAGITLAHRVQRPWHQALLTERAALLHLEQGLSNTGYPLMAAAYSLYQAWGADAKLRQIRERHGAAIGTSTRIATSRADQPQGSSNGLTSDTVDLLGILRASQALSSETGLDRLHARVNETLSALTGATNVRIVLCDQDSGEWYLPPVSGPDTSDVMSVAEAERQRLVPLSAFHYVQHSGETLIVEDATCDDRFARDPYFAGIDRCSLLVVPIRKQGVSRAILLLENRLSRGAFSTDRLDAVALIAGQLAVSLDNALMYASLEKSVAERTRELQEANRRLEALSNTDALTGLVNRRRFMTALDEEWKRALRTNGGVAIAMIDIDHFKKYNDHYGHLAGDACLRQVAMALQGSARQGVDIIARYGGEEFAAIMPGADTDTARSIAERMRQSVIGLGAPHAQSDIGSVSVSIGIAASALAGAITAEALIHLADGALYDAKRDGRDRVCEADFKGFRLCQV